MKALSLFLVLQFVCFQALGAIYLQGKVVLLDVGGAPEGIAKNLKVTVFPGGNSDVTTTDGHFRIPLTRSQDPGSEYELQVEHPELRIYRPVGGRDRIPAEPDKAIVTVQLLPKGSRLFLSAADIELLIKNGEEQGRRTAQSANSEIKADLSRYRNKWITKYGIPVEEVQQKVLAWADEVRDDPGQAAKGYFMMGSFEMAARLWKEAAILKLRRSEHEVANGSQLRAAAATDLEASGEAKRAAGNQREALLLFAEALENVARNQLPLLWASLQNSLGNCHSELSLQSEGPPVAEHQIEAVNYYQAALEAFTREHSPQDWATVKSNLGNVLRQSAERATQVEAVKLLNTAIGFYHESLEVRTLERLPEDWAQTQSNLAIALRDKGKCISDPEGAQLLTNATGAFRAVLLHVYTRERFPREWGRNQSNLGATLSELAVRVNRPESVQLLREAVSAFQAALQVYTRPDHPYDWARTQSNLGATLGALAKHANGPEQIQWLDDGISAIQGALEVFTRRDTPQDWAMAQFNLGLTLRMSRPQSEQMVLRAITAFQAALLIYNEEEFPKFHGLVVANLKAAQVALTNTPP